MFCISRLICFSITLVSSLARFFCFAIISGISRFVVLNWICKDDFGFGFDDDLIQRIISIDQDIICRDLLRFEDIIDGEESLNAFIEAIVSDADFGRVRIQGVSGCIVIMNFLDFVRESKSDDFIGELECLDDGMRPDVQDFIEADDRGYDGIFGRPVFDGGSCFVHDVQLTVVDDTERLMFRDFDVDLVGQIDRDFCFFYPCERFDARFENMDIGFEEVRIFVGEPGCIQNGGVIRTHISMNRDLTGLETAFVNLVLVVDINAVGNSDGENTCQNDLEQNEQETLPSLPINLADFGFATAILTDILRHSEPVDQGGYCRWYCVPGQRFGKFFGLDILLQVPAGDCSRNMRELSANEVGIL